MEGNGAMLSFSDEDKFMPQNRSITLGVIVGNRDFFPDALVTQGRRDILEVLAERGDRSGHSRRAIH